MSHRTRVDRAMNRLIGKINAQEQSRVPLVFVAGNHGEITAMSHSEFYTFMGISPAAQAAVDIMVDDGFPAKEAWEFALAMDRLDSSRGDAEAQARHFVELRKVMRGMDVSS